MAMFYFFPNKFWTSRSPLCTPFVHHFGGLLNYIIKFQNCIATSIVLRLNIPLCFDLEYFAFTTLLWTSDFYSKHQV
jgi:hypothetical protein